LNRNGKFQTVTRLYAKYEILYAYQANNRFYDKVKEQFNYARENLESIRRASGQAGPEGQDDSIRYAILTHVIRFIKRLLFLGCSFFIFTLIYKTVRLTPTNPLIV
jgi:hypothetical protein